MELLSTDIASPQKKTVFDLVQFKKQVAMRKLLPRTGKAMGLELLHHTGRMCKPPTIFSLNAKGLPSNICSCFQVQSLSSHSEVQLAQRWGFSRWRQEAFT